MDFLLPAFILLAFWLLVLRPTAKRAKAARELHASLAVGNRVMLTSGIYGTIVELRDASVLLSVAAGVEIEVARQAVATVVPFESDEQGGADQEGADQYGAERGEDD